MRILLSNDDGVAALGLAELYRQLASLAECVVVAPDRDCSGLSSAITLDRPLRVTEHSTGFLGVNGTPVDCVQLAVHTLLADNPPDRVISGINRGANLGDDVIYSGTVAAAMEGRCLAKSAVAVSLCGNNPRYLKGAGQVVKTLLQQLEHIDLARGTILNVNIPACDITQIRGIKMTRLGHRTKPEPPVRVTDPRGKTAYWIAPLGREQDAGEGTDFHAIANGYISITPLQFDQTQYNALSQLERGLGGDTWG